MIKRISVYSTLKSGVPPGIFFSWRTQYPKLEFGLEDKKSGDKYMIINVYCDDDKAYDEWLLSEYGIQNLGTKKRL